MEKFTASEVRESAIAVVARDMEYEAGMLHAYADLLEAREKAVPVAWRSLSLPTTFICDAPKNLDCEKWQPLYTQPPAASVPNGLIDALRHQRQIDECGDEVGVSRQAVDEAIAILTMLAAQENPNG